MEKFVLKEPMFAKKEYEFLYADPFLGSNIMLLGYGGSHAYGTNVPTSDIDIRGITRNPRSCILGTENFEQKDSGETDTVIYGLRKACSLLAGGNPNVIEILGLRDYFYLDKRGKELLENRDMFLSKRIVNSFGGYATAQLRRLENALAHDAYPEAEKNKHIVGSIKNAMVTFNERYQKTLGVSVRLNEKNDIVVDMSLQGYPLQDAHGILSEMRSIIREYDKLNHRNRKKDDAHLNKHAMHLVRLLITGEEILRSGVIRTYRDKEHDLLMDIRNGKYQKEDHTFCPEFFEMLDEFDKKFRYAADNTILPDKPNMKRIEDFLISVNLETIKRGDIPKIPKERKERLTLRSRETGGIYDGM